MTAPLNIAEGRALLAKATPGPWMLAAPDAFPWYQEGCGERGEDTIAILGAGGYGVFSAPYSITDYTSVNLKLFIWLRNHADALLDAAEQNVRLTAELAATRGGKD